MSYSWRLKNVLEQIEMIENTLSIIFLIHNTEEPQTFSRFKKNKKLSFIFRNGNMEKNELQGQFYSV
jgi:hypothetical protein